ncbi:MAG: hypothetical protein OHK0046_35440 [Anaerolineae bacterium]
MFIAGLVIFVGMTGVCSVVTYTVAREFVINTEASGVALPSFQDFVAAQPTATITPPPTSTPQPTNTPPPGVTFTPEPTSEAQSTGESVNVTGDDAPVIEPWTDPSRITILLMGIDQRTAVDDPGPFRTDTMILVQIDPIQERVGVLSIPRDLWVQIPGFQYGRITQANYLGDQEQLPEGGPGLAMETVYANIGVDVDYFVRINFEVFTTVVETLAPNGVEVCPEEAILDEKYPDDGLGFIVVRFEPGCQRLDPVRLLQYARTRATQGGDFDRNRRQQEVLRGLQAEVLSAGGIVNFVTQIPQLYTDLAGSFVTNLDPDTIIRLAGLVGNISQEDVTFKAINNLHVTFATTETGDQILIPIQDEIRGVVREAFEPQPNLSIAELRDRAAQENASIVVYNATDTAGLASQTRDWLTSRGITVTAVGNIEPPTNPAEITIRDYTGAPWTARYLAAVMGLPASAVRNATDGLTSADVMIVVGTDVQALLAGQ